MILSPPTKPLPIDKAGQFIYPVDNGEPLSNDTEHLQWIKFVESGLTQWLADSGCQAFVCGDVLWYPVEGRSDISMAPDVMAVLDHPPGYRSSYMQWKEPGQRPIQVAFEFMSSGNTASEMIDKLDFYSDFGCEEFYIYDYQRKSFRGYDCKQSGAPLSKMQAVNGVWHSRLLDVTLGLNAAGRLWIKRGDGRMMETYEELAARAKSEEQHRERLAAKLRELGIDPDAL